MIPKERRKVMFMNTFWDYFYFYLENYMFIYTLRVFPAGEVLYKTETLKKVNN